MGLAERRRIAIIKDQHGPRFRKELNDAIGLSLPLEIAKSPEGAGDKRVSVDGRTLVIGESFWRYSDKLYGEDDLRKTLENIL